MEAAQHLLATSGWRGHLPFGFSGVALSALFVGFVPVEISGHRRLLCSIASNCWGVLKECAKWGKTHHLSAVHQIDVGWAGEGARFGESRFKDMCLAYGAKQKRLASPLLKPAILLKPSSIPHVITVLIGWRLPRFQASQVGEQPPQV